MVICVVCIVLFGINLVCAGSNKDDVVEGKIKMMIADMTLQEKAAQVLLLLLSCVYTCKVYVRARVCARSYICVYTWAFICACLRM